MQIKNLLLVLFIFYTNSLMADVIVIGEAINQTDFHQLKNSNSYSLSPQPDKETHSSHSITLSPIDILEISGDTQTSTTGGFGQQSNVFIRGGNRGDHVTAINGISLEDPLDINRSIEVNHLPADLFDQVEISKGPQPLSHGANAISGTINYQTRTSSLPPEINIFMGEKNTTGLNGKISTKNLSFRSSHLKSAGISSANEKKDNYRESDSFSRTSIFAEFKKKTILNTRLKFFAFLHNSQNEIDATDFSTSLPIDKKDDDLSLSQISIYSLKLERLFINRSLSSELSINRKNTKRNNTGNEFEGYVNEIIFHNNLLFNENHSLSFAIQYAQENALKGLTQSQKSVERLETFISNYLQLQSWSIQAGIRASKPQDWSTQWGGRMAIQKNLSPTSHIRWSWTRAFKYPSLYQRFAPEYLGKRVGNPALKPLLADSYEVSFNIKQITKVSLFYQKNKQIIEYDTEMGYQNQDKTRVKGVEISTTLKNKRFSFNQSLNFLSAVLLPSKSYLARRSRFQAIHNVNTALSPNTSMSFIHRYIGDRNDYGRLPSHQIFDIAFNQHHTSAFQSWLKIKNIFNTSYESLRGYGTYDRFFIGGIKMIF